MISTFKALSNAMNLIEKSLRVANFVFIVIYSNLNNHEIVHQAKSLQIINSKVYSKYMFLY